ncbi:MAG: S-layer homology domain-containing protein [Bacillota bacterium]|nr:S-layer homology domain-containing protein [Bacillota bacterium]
MWRKPKRAGPPGLPFFVVLVLALVLTLGAGPAWAAPSSRLIPAARVFDDVDGPDAQAFAVLAAVGAFRGDRGIGGPVRPAEAIQRAEFASVLAQLSGHSGVASVMGSFQPPYSDAAAIPDWARGAVNVAYSAGLLRGYPDGSFRPDRPVSQAEVLAALARMAGYTSASGSWPSNWVNLADSKGLADKAKVDAGAAASRAFVARAAYRTLFAPGPDGQTLFARTGGAEGEVAVLGSSTIRIRHPASGSAIRNGGRILSTRGLPPAPAGVRPLPGALAALGETVTYRDPDLFTLAPDVIAIGFSSWSDLKVGSQVRLYLDGGRVTGIELVG